MGVGRQTSFPGFGRIVSRPTDKPTSEGLQARSVLTQATEGSVLKAEAKPERADKPAKQAC
jgi:hypothetical protein